MKPKIIAELARKKILVLFLDVGDLCADHYFDF